MSLISFRSNLNNLIAKEERKDASLEVGQRDILSSVFRSQLPQMKKVEFNVETQSLGETGTPIMITQSGLNRYDGVKMNVYRHQDGMSGTLGHDIVTCVLEVEPGCVLVGMESGVQVSSYDTDKFTDVPHTANIKTLF